MFKIIISEDDDKKFNKIIEEIKSLDFEIEITREISINGTINNCLDKDYHLLIQDMNLPKYTDGKGKDLLGGIKVMKYLKKQKYNIDKVICSSSETLKEDLEKSGFVDVSFVQFNHSKSDWREPLKSLISEKLINLQG